MNNVIKYKGYVISQSLYNYHVMITKDDKMVFHASINEKLTDDDLKNIVDFYLTFDSKEYENNI